MESKPRHFMGDVHRLLFCSLLEVGHCRRKKFVIAHRKNLWPTSLDLMDRAERATLWVVGWASGLIRTFVIRTFRLFPYSAVSTTSSRVLQTYHRGLCLLIPVKAPCPVDCRREASTVLYEYIGTVSPEKSSL